MVGPVVDVGTFTGRDIIVQFGLTVTPVSFRRRIQRFLESYLGTSQAPIAFGGRTLEFEALNQWLSDPDPRAPRNFLITGEAGRGKTTLIVRWLDQLNTDFPIAFFPISIRYGTSRPSIFYQGLAARLAEILDENLPATATDPADFYKEQVIECLDRFEKTKKRCLIVIDGLDEASGWNIDTSILPSYPIPGLRFVISARFLTGDKDESGWLRRLGWDTSPNYARHIRVDRLDQKGIADVFVKSGASLSDPSKNADVLKELERVTNGDPLLLTYYIKDLLKPPGDPTWVQPEQLHHREAGFGSYFEEWLAKQGGIFHEAGTAFDEQTIKAILSVLACAMGPLQLKDLAELIRKIHGSERIIARDTLEPLRRFVIGDGTDIGYSLGHPKLGQYLREDYFGDSNVIIRTKAGFLEWGRETIHALENKTLAPEATPSYLLLFYAQHLQTEEADPILFRELVCNGWRLAWEALEGFSAGFLNDIELAWSRAESAIPPVAGDDITVMIKCALCRSSAVTLSSNIPPDLLSLCVRHRILPPRQALTFATYITDHHMRSEALSQLAPTLPIGLMEDALAAVRAIKDEQSRSKALVALVPYLVEELKGEAIQEALATLRVITSEQNRATVLTSLAQYLPEALKPSAVALATEIDNPSDRAHTLTALAPSLREDLRTAVVQKVLAILGEITYERDRATTLISLAPHIPAALKAEALQAARQIGDKEVQVRALTGLVPYLPKGLKPKVVREALKAARQIGDKEVQVRALTGLVPYLPKGLKPKVVREALKAARASTDVMGHPLTVADLVPHLPDELKPEVLGEAFEAALQMTDGEARPLTLASLVPHLPEELLKDALAAAQAEDSGWASKEILVRLSARLPEDLLREALKLAQAIGDVHSRVGALAGLSPYLPEHLKRQTLHQALEATRMIDHELTLEEALIAIAPHVPEALLSEALAAARAKGTKTSVKILIGLAENLPDGMRSEATKQALSAAQAIQDEGERVRVLVALTPYLSSQEGMLKKALEAARTIGNGEEQVSVLTNLAPFLPKDLQTEVIMETLARIQKLPERHWLGRSPRAAAITALAPHLTKALRMEVLDTSRAMKDLSARVGALIGLARFLEKRQKAKVLREALEASRAIGNPQEQAFALTRIVPELPEGQRKRVVDQALEAARQSPPAPAKPMVLIAAIMAPSASEMALAGVVQRLAPYISEELQSELLSTNVPHLGDELIVDVLNSLAPFLSGKSLRQANELLWVIEDADYRWAAIAGLARQHPDTQMMNKVLKAVRLIKSEWIRAMALANLASYLPDVLKEKATEEALAAMLVIRDESLRKEALQALAPLLLEWANAHPSSAYSGWKETLREFSAQPRPTFLLYIQTLLPFALALTSDNEREKAAVGVFQAIQEIGRWWE